MNWQRLTAVRTVVLVVLGLVSLCITAFLYAVMAGCAAIGVSLLLLAYLTDPSGGAR